MVLESILKKYNKVNDNQYLKKEFNILESDFVIASIGELNNNKNQMYALKSIKELVADKPNLKYLLVGEGKNKK